MKKILTILMIVAAILVGGMTVEAKTTKKNSKARTTQSTGKSNSNNLGIMTFCTTGDKYSGPSGKSVNEIIASLEKLGFKYQDTYNSTFSVYDESEYEYINEPAQVMVYTKGHIFASVYIRVYNSELEMDNSPYQILLMFNNDSEEKKFIANVKANGFNAQSYDYETYYMYSKQACGVCVIKTEGADEMIKVEFFESH